MIAYLVWNIDHWAHKMSLSFTISIDELTLHMCFTVWYSDNTVLPWGAIKEWKKVLLHAFPLTLWKACMLQTKPFGRWKILCIAVKEYHALSAVLHSAKKIQILNADLREVAKLHNLKCFSVKKPVILCYEAFML